MSNIPKPPKLPKAKSVTSTDHNSQEHENMLIKTWKNLENILNDEFYPNERFLNEAKKTQIDSFLETYKNRLAALKRVLLTVTKDDHKSLINAAITKLEDYINKFAPPELKLQECLPVITDKKYQAELFNDKNITVGYADISADFTVFNELELWGGLHEGLTVYRDFNEDTEPSAEELTEANVKKICDFELRKPYWHNPRKKHRIYFDVRPIVPTVAQLTRELLVIKSYINYQYLAVVFNKIDDPLIPDVLLGHDIMAIDLSNYKIA